MYKYKDNSFINVVKVITSYSNKNTGKFTNLTLMLNVSYEWRSKLDWSTWRDIPNDCYAQYEDNPWKINTVIAQIRRNLPNSIILPWRPMSYKGQGQIQLNTIFALKSNQ